MLEVAARPIQTPTSLSSNRTNVLIDPVEYYAYIRGHQSLILTFNDLQAVRSQESYSFRFLVHWTRYTSISPITMHSVIC